MYLEGISVKQFCVHCQYDQITGQSLMFRAGEVLFWEGDQLDKIYQIKSGYVKMNKLSDNGDERIIGLLHEGDYLALLALLQGKKEYIANATALSNIEVKVMNKDDVLEAYRRNDLFKDHCLSCAVMRSNLFQSQIVNSATSNTDEKILNVLKTLSESYGRKSNNEIRIELPFSKTVLANFIGIQRETLSRHLSSMQKERILRIEKNNYYLQYVI